MTLPSRRGFYPKKLLPKPNSGITRTTIVKKSDEDSQAAELPMPPVRLGQTPPFASMNMTKPPDNSDLMSRLQNFLPQMKSANQELLSAPFPTPSIGFDPVRLDENLKLDEDSDSDSDDEDEKDSKTNPLIQEVGANDRVNDENDAKRGSTSSPDSKKTTNNENSAPTIQLEFTLGNMSGNPLMKLLANDEDEAEDADSSAGGDVDNPSDDAREIAVSNLLTESNNSSCGSAETKNNILVLQSATSGSDCNASNKTTTKKRLITELS